jgi:hypothetical protein
VQQEQHAWVWTPQGELLNSCGDAVAALVGVGYFLLSTTRFNRSFPSAVKRLSSELRRRSRNSGGSCSSFWENEDGGQVSVQEEQGAHA